RLRFVTEVSPRGFRCDDDKIRIVDPERGIDARQNDSQWVARQRARERQKLIGLLLLVLFIVVLVLVRFGKTVPWGAR
ncbi:MAG: hypothetical protein WAM71_17210, partial [Candidatus Korobacteraceae bacterium]